MPAEELIAELRSRGISFEPANAFWKDLAAASDDRSLPDELKAAKRVSVGASDDATSVSAMVATATAVKGRDFQGALRRMRPAIEKDPKNSDLLLAAGVILREMEDYENASRALAGAAKLAPGSAYVHGQLSLVCYRMGDTQCAETEARTMLQLAPDSSDGYKYLGLALSTRGDAAGAMKAYERALEINPKNAWVYYDIGVLRAQQKRWPEAVTAYQHAIDQQQIKDSTAYNNLGIALGRMGRVDEAVAAFEQGRTLDPSDPRLLQSYGGTLCNAGRYEQAIEVFNALLASTPSWNMARPCLYRSLMRVGRTEEAKQVKEDYVKYSSEHQSW